MNNRLDMKDFHGIVDRLPRSGKKQNLGVLRVFVYPVKFIEMRSEADFTGVVRFLIFILTADL